MTRLSLMGGLLFGVLTLVLLWPERSYVSIHSRNDMFEYVAIAFNIIHHGDFDIRLPGKRPSRTNLHRMKREPGYPAYLTAVFSTVPGFRALSLDCLQDDQCAASGPARLRLSQADAVVSAVLVAATFCAAGFVTGSGLLAALAALLWLFLLPAPESGAHLIALLLLGHSVLAYAAWRRPRAVTGVLGGIALGLLVLTEAVFQYWLAILPLVCAAGLWRDAGRRRSRLLPMAAMMIAALALSLPWMVRNAVQAGQFSMTSGGAEVLAIRAEYGRMTWSEVRGVFAFYLPLPGEVRRAAMRWLEPEEFSYSRFDRSNPEGFYRRIKSSKGDVWTRVRQMALHSGARLAGLTVGAVYEVQIRVRVGGEWSGPSASATTTPAQPPSASRRPTLGQVRESPAATVPARPPSVSAPTGLTAEWMGDVVALSWDHPGDSGVTGYQFRVREPKETDWMPWRVIDLRARNTLKKRAALEFIREDWPKHLALTLAFAERGAQFWYRNFRAARDGYAAEIWSFLQFPSQTARWLGLLFLPALGLMSILAWRRRAFPLALLLLPVAYAFLFHAAATHFIPRYSRPFVPILAVIFALAAKEVWRPVSSFAARLARPKSSGRA